MESGAKVEGAFKDLKTFIVKDYGVEREGEVITISIVKKLYGKSRRTKRS